MSFPPKRGQFREGSLDQYLKEISQYPLIDRAEEVRLAKAIHKGEEEALNKLVRSNLRFVVSVAKKYQNRGRGINSTRRRASSSSAMRYGGFGRPSFKPWQSRAALSGSP